MLRKNKQKAIISSMLVSVIGASGASVMSSYAQDITSDTKMPMTGTVAGTVGDGRGAAGVAEDNINNFFDGIEKAGIDAGIQPNVDVEGTNDVTSDRMNGNIVRNVRGDIEGGADTSATNDTNMGGTSGMTNTSGTSGIGMTNTSGTSGIGMTNTSGTSGMGETTSTSGTSGMGEMTSTSGMGEMTSTTKQDIEGEADQKPNPATGIPIFELGAAGVAALTAAGVAIMGRRKM